MSSLPLIILSFFLSHFFSHHLQDFPGICTCTLDDGLDTILDTIRRTRVHRLLVVDEVFRLKGVLTLSDILRYLILHGHADDS